MSPWLNFCYVISGQFIVLVIVLRLRRHGLAAAWHVIWRSLLLGVPLGLGYDIFIGHGRSIFLYHGVPDSWLFSIANGALSYGLAIATARFIPVRLDRSYGRAPHLAGLGFLALSLSAVLLYLNLELPTLPSMFVLGAVLILTSEGLAAIAGYAGPVMSVMFGRMKPLVSVWLYSLFIGAAYELLNTVFPLWRWLLSDTHPLLIVEALVIVLGYTALFLPMVLISRLLIRHDHTADDKNET